MSDLFIRRPVMTTLVMVGLFLFGAGSSYLLTSTFVVLVLYTADRIVKARAQVRRLRSMSDRLAAATAKAEEQQERHQAAERASEALTSVLPAIQRPPLTVPGMPYHLRTTDLEVDLPPPLLGEHTNAILTELGHQTEFIGQGESLNRRSFE